MAKGCKKDNENIYFKARKNAASYNEKLYSREGAAEMLGLSVSAIADYELGITKVVPVDKVVLMADLYNCPELKANYCKNECPIGENMNIATEVEGIQGSALRLLKELDVENIKEVKRKLLDIALDGEIDESKIEVFKEVLDKVEQISKAISEIKLLGEKVLGKA